MFPGQGTQKPGMLNALGSSIDKVNEVFEIANDVTGRDVRELCLSASAEELVKTENTQVAVTAMNLAYLKLLDLEGVKPDIVLGHSLGQFSAFAAKSVEEAFSSEYINKQMSIMLENQSTNPTEAIGKAKELIESCCETILERNGITPNKDWKLNQLVDETMKLLEITPKHIPDTAKEATAIKAILGSLRGIATNIAIIRNAYGSGHGKSASYKGLQERHAKLAIGSSVTLVNFLWDSFERKNSVRN